jgi:hypothetical protein
MTTLSDLYAAITTVTTNALGQNTAAQLRSVLTQVVNYVGQSVPQLLGSANPLPDGTAAPGTAVNVSHEDHVHPSDTTRAALTSPAFTGTPTAPTAAAAANTTQLATTAFAHSLLANLAPADLPAGYIPKFAIRRYLRQAPDLYDWGASPGGSDCVSAWNQAISDLRQVYQLNELYIPPGNWFFASQANAVDFGLNVYGDNESYSVLNIRHNGNGFVATGQYGVGGSLRNLSVDFDGPATASTFGVYLVANQLGYSPDFFDVENVNISSLNGGTISYPLCLDGLARPTTLYTGTVSSVTGTSIVFAGNPFTTNQFANGLLQLRATSGGASGQFRTIVSNTTNTIVVATAFGVSPAAASVVVESVLVGIRNVTLRNITGFNGTARGAEFRNARDFQAYKLSLFTANGTNNDVYVVGQSTTNTAFGSLYGMNIGTLYMSKAGPGIYAGTPSAIQLVDNVTSNKFVVPAGLTVTNVDPGTCTGNSPNTGTTT